MEQEKNTIDKNVLSEEILLIRNEQIKTWTKETLLKVPDYFFTGAASSTGKYHPSCSLGVGGLITHVKRAVYIANRLCDGYGMVNDERDKIISATILHDIAKIGRNSGSYQDYINHPLNAEKYFVSTEPPFVEEINNCIKNHMGLWTPESIKKDISKYTLSELIVYTADYIATTKDLITPKDKKELEVSP